MWMALEEWPFACERLLSSAWVAALLLWSASLLWRPLGDLARYGKLATPHQQPWLHLSRATGFRVLYSVALCWSAAVAALLPASSRLHAVLLTAHVAQRWAESMFVHRFSSALMTWPGLAMALGFYIVVPLHCACDSTHSTPNRALSPVVIVAVFVLCCFRQHRCHAALAALRPHGGDAYVSPPATREFVWARGSPHYVYECVIYICLALACDSTASWLCAAFVLANQTQLLLQSRAFYTALQQRAPEQPQMRR